jgi:general secretion pathway protein D
VAVGATFSVLVTLNGGSDIASVPMKISYDPAKLSLVNVDKGDYLGRDGQAWDLSHRDDPPGLIVINASRPQGTPGISGSGVVYLLSFQAKATGESAIEITHPGAVTSAQKQVPAQGARASIQVQ